jgi:hypothetical protein
MTWIAALLLLSAAGDVRTKWSFDDSVDINAGKIRTLDVPVEEDAARVLCSFLVTSGGSGVRVLLMSEAESEKYVRGLANQPIAAAGYSRRGSFSEAVRRKGLYRLVIDNRMEGRGSTTLQLTVKLAYGEPVGRPASELDPARRRGVILLSFAAFFLIAVPAGFALRRGQRRA